MDKANIPSPLRSLKGRAKELWRYYAQELDKRQLFIEADHSALERLCRLEVQADDLTAEIEKTGVVVRDSKGDQRGNPSLMTLAQLSGIIEGLKRSLSIGAYYRHRIGEQPKPEKPVSRIMQYRNKPYTGSNGQRN